MASRTFILCSGILCSGFSFLLNSYGNSVAAQSSTDKKEFAAVYDYLSNIYAQREASRDLYDTVTAYNNIQNSRAASNAVSAPPFPTSSQPQNNPATLPATIPVPAPPAASSQTSIPDLETPTEEFAFPEDTFEEFDTGVASNNGFYFGAYATGTYPKAGTLTETDADTSTDTSTDTVYDLTSKFNIGGGALAGYRFDPLRIEVEGAYFRSLRTKTEQDPATDTTSDNTTISAEAAEINETTTVIAGLANAYYALSLGSLELLLGGSVGYGSVTRELEDETLKGTGLIYGPGVGIVYNISDQISLAAQYRYLISGTIKDTTTEKEIEATQHQAFLAFRYQF